MHKLDSSQRREHTSAENTRPTHAVVPPARTGSERDDDDHPWGAEDHIVRGID